MRDLEQSANVTVGNHVGYNEILVEDRVGYDEILVDVHRRTGQSSQQAVDQQ